MSAFIGIDLGTTFSSVATIDETGRPQIIPNDKGENLTPSCVVEEKGDKGTMRIGEFARRQWCNAPETAAARFKRDMGTSKKHTINGKEYTPTQLSAFVLKKLVQDAEKELGSIGEAVVTVPANFANEAREATMAAAKEAGLNVSYIINEPTAAALYYAFKSGEELGGVYAVYDLGGGTFDVSIIEINGHDVDVLASQGVVKLGGLDFDEIVHKLVREKYKDQTGNELEKGDFTLNDAEEEKRHLSEQKKVSVECAREIVDIKRAEFEEAISSLVTQTKMACEGAVKEAGIDFSDIKGVFLAGGSTRIPLVTETVKNVFKQEPIKTVNVDEVVSLGAVIYAAYKGDRTKLSPVQKQAIDKIEVTEQTSMYYGTIALGEDLERSKMKEMNSIIIQKGEKIPCSKTEPYYTVGDGQEGVHCRVTEARGAETDVRFAKIIWEGELKLPPDRPAGQEIKITFGFDVNQMMHCSFVDVATKRKTDIDISMTSSKDHADKIDPFLVE